jgi:hypothetical protein
VRDSPYRNHLSPQQWRQKTVLMSDRTRWETPRGRYDEHNSKFSLSMKPKFNRPVGEKNHFWKVVASWLWQGALPVSATTWNLYTTQPNYFAPTYSEVVNLTGFCWKQRIRRMVWKEMFVCSEWNKIVLAERNSVGSRWYYECKRMDQGQSSLEASLHKDN